MKRIPPQLLFTRQNKSKRRINKSNRISFNHGRPEMAASLPPNYYFASSSSYLPTIETCSKASVRYYNTGDTNSPSFFGVIPTTTSFLPSNCYSNNEMFLKSSSSWIYNESSMLTSPSSTRHRTTSRSTCIRWNSNTTNNNSAGGGSKNLDNDKRSIESIPSTTTTTRTDSVKEQKEVVETVRASNKSDNSSSGSSNSTASEKSQQSSATNHSAASYAEGRGGEPLSKRAQMILLEEKFRQTVYDQWPRIIVALVAGICVSAPYVVQYMQRNTNPSTQVEDLSDDPVDEFVKLVKRHEWDLNEFGNDNLDDDDDKSLTDKTKDLLQSMLTDVLKSPKLQQAAQDFLVQLITSDGFKLAASRLVKELFTDLINDPETIRQVLHLLEIAIQDVKIKQALQKLVIQIIEDEVVKTKLIELVQTLVMDDVVKDAMIELLTESAHATLSDPDVLDHSMEFATDVVGDDTVQRTAGEALRNTVGHALTAKPVVTATSTAAVVFVLTALGFGFVYLGMVSLGYSRSSSSGGSGRTRSISFDRDVAALLLNRRAAMMKNYHAQLPKISLSGTVHVLSWPVRIIVSGMTYVNNQLLYPIILSIVSGVTNTSQNIYLAICNSFSQAFVVIPISMFHAINESLANGAIYLEEQIVSHIQQPLYHIAVKCIQNSRNIVSTTYAYLSSILSTMLTKTVTALSQSIPLFTNTITTITESVQEMVSSLTSLTLQCWTNTINSISPYTVKVWDITITALSDIRTTSLKSILELSQSVHKYVSSLLVQSSSFTKEDIINFYKNCIAVHVLLLQETIKSWFRKQQEQFNPAIVNNVYKTMNQVDESIEKVYWKIDAIVLQLWNMIVQAYRNNNEEIQ